LLKKQGIIFYNASTKKFDFFFDIDWVSWGKYEKEARHFSK
jgi:hypothetical protein